MHKAEPWTGAKLPRSRWGVGSWVSHTNRARMFSAMAVLKVAHSNGPKAFICSSQLLESLEYRVNQEPSEQLCQPEKSPAFMPVQ